MRTVSRTIGTGVTQAMKRIVTFVAFLFVTESVYACQCSRRLTPQEALRSAHAVFQGTVISRRMVLAREHGWLFPVPEYEFRVSRAWKGIATPNVRLLGGYSNCAYVFRQNTSYLVFVGRHRERPDHLSSSICDPTRPASEEGASFAALGKPTVVFVKTNDRSSAAAERIQSYAIAGIAVFGNLLRHGSDRGSWSYLGLPAAVLSALTLTTLVSVVFTSRRWRRALALLTLSIVLAVASLLAAGQHVYRDSWFSRYLE